MYRHARPLLRAVVYPLPWSLCRSAVGLLQLGLCSSVFPTLLCDVTQLSPSVDHTWHGSVVLDVTEKRRLVDRDRSFEPESASDMRGCFWLGCFNGPGGGRTSLQLWNIANSNERFRPT